MKPLIQMLYGVQKWLWRTLRPRTTGVKVLLFDAGGKLMLIRNSYGATDQFVLPGGGVRPFEKPAAAAAREMREELGCQVRDLAFVATYRSTAEGKRDTVHLFKAVMKGEPAIDRWEVAEAGIYPPHDLPPATSPATRRRIGEFLGERPFDDKW